MMNARLSTIIINVRLIAQLAHSMSPLTINTPQFIVNHYISLSKKGLDTTFADNH